MYIRLHILDSFPFRGRSNFFRILSLDWWNFRQGEFLKPHSLRGPGKATWVHAFCESWLAPNYQPVSPIGCCMSIESPPLPLSISCAPIENACLLFPRAGRRKTRFTDSLPELCEPSRQRISKSSERGPLSSVNRRTGPLNWMKKRVVGWKPGGIKNKKKTFTLWQNRGASGDESSSKRATPRHRLCWEQTREWHKHSQRWFCTRHYNHCCCELLFFFWREVGLRKVCLLLIGKGIDNAGPNHSFRVCGRDEWRL